MSYRNSPSRLSRDISEFDPRSGDDHRDSQHGHTYYYSPTRSPNRSSIRSPTRTNKTPQNEASYSNSKYRPDLSAERLRPVAVDEVKNYLRKDFEDLRREVQELRDRNKSRRIINRESPQRYLNYKDPDLSGVTSASRLDRTSPSRPQFGSEYDESFQQHARSHLDEAESRLHREERQRSLSRERQRTKELEMQLEKDRQLRRQNESLLSEKSKPWNESYESPQRHNIPSRTRSPERLSRGSPIGLSRGESPSRISHTANYSQLEANKIFDETGYSRELFELQLNKLRSENRRIKRELDDIRASFTRQLERSEEFTTKPFSLVDRLQEVENSMRYDSPLRTSPSRGKTNRASPSPSRNDTLNRSIRSVKELSGSPSKRNRGVSSRKKSDVQESDNIFQSPARPSRGRKTAEDISQLVSDVKQKVHLSLRENEEKRQKLNSSTSGRRSPSSSYNPKYEILDRSGSKERKRSKSNGKHTSPSYLAKKKKYPEASTLLHFGLASRPPAEIHREVEFSQAETMRHRKKKI